MSPINVIKQEHAILYKAINAILSVQNIEDDEKYHSIMHELIIFVRNFTELFHFPKEDKILYPLLQGRVKNLCQEFKEEIYDNHEDFKFLIAEMEKHFVYHNYKLLRTTTLAYLNELKTHLIREDELVLKKAEELLSDEDKIQILSEFQKIDEKQGVHEKENLIETFYRYQL